MEVPVQVLLKALPVDSSLAAAIALTAIYGLLSPLGYAYFAVWCAQGARADHGAIVCSQRKRCGCRRPARRAGASTGMAPAHAACRCTPALQEIRALPRRSNGLWW